jgi:hypothetical protein
MSLKPLLHVLSSLSWNIAQISKTADALESITQRSLKNATKGRSLLGFPQAVHVASRDIYADITEGSFFLQVPRKSQQQWRPVSRCIGARAAVIGGPTPLSLPPTESSISYSDSANEKPRRISCYTPYRSSNPTRFILRSLSNLPILPNL